jgi:hypothetical protein
MVETDFRWFGLWSTSTLISLLLATSFLNSFDCIQDSIYREIVWTLQVFSTSTLTIINLIYHFTTFVSWMLVTLSQYTRKPNGKSRTLRFNLEHQRARKKKKKKRRKERYYSLNWNISFYDWNLISEPKVLSSNLDSINSHPI